MVAGLELRPVSSKVNNVSHNGPDLVTGMHVRMGIGYGLLPFPEVLAFLPEGRLAGWGGAGGSLVIADADRCLTFAYVMNQMRPQVVGPVAEALVKRLYEIVKG